MDVALAESYIGKHLLVGVTYQDHDGTLIEQKQFHGTIVRINEQEGVVIRLQNSAEEFKLPPDLDSLKDAPEGEYRLHSTNEIIVNPDLVTTWTSTKPAPGDV